MRTQSSRRIAHRDPMGGSNESRGRIAINWTCVDEPGTTCPESDDHARGHLDRGGLWRRLLRGESNSASDIVQSGDLDAPAQEAPSPATAEGEQAAADTGDADSVPSDVDPEEIAPEDVFLMFAQCLRDEGLDVSDPDFSSGRGPGGFLRDIDRQGGDDRQSDCGRVVRCRRAAVDDLRSLRPRDDRGSLRRAAGEHQFGSTRRSRGKPSLGCT